MGDLRSVGVANGGTGADPFGVLPEVLREESCGHGRFWELRGAADGGPGGAVGLVAVDAKVHLVMGGVRTAMLMRTLRFYTNLNS